MSVAAFGTFDAPRYACAVDIRIAPADASRGDSARAWCCPFGKGHKTVRAAAQHGARLAEDAWKR